VGGTLYHYAPSFEDAPRQAFASAVVLLAGDLLGVHYPKDFPLAPDTTRLLDLKRQHPALQQLSTRRQLPTTADDKYYAFLRIAADRSERILVVTNFQSTPDTVRLDLSGVARPVAEESPHFSGRARSDRALCGRAGLRIRTVPGAVALQCVGRTSRSCTADLHVVVGRTFRSARRG